MYTENSNFSFNIEFWRDFTCKYFLPFANRSRWFAGKSRNTHDIIVRHVIEWSPQVSYLLFVDVVYVDNSETYFLPVCMLPSKTSDFPEKGLIVETIASDNEKNVFIDAIYDETFRHELFNRFINETIERPLSAARIEKITEPYESSDILVTDSTNTLMVFNSKYLFKVYRKLTDKMNQEVQMLTFLGKSDIFLNRVPRCLGTISSTNQNVSTVILVLIQNFIPNAHDYWSVVTGLTGEPVTEEILIEKVDLLGRRTAEMHLILSKAEAANVEFASEMFTHDYCQFISQSLNERLKLFYSQLASHSSSFAKCIFESKDLLMNFISTFQSRSFQSRRIQVHGDLHLGQILFNKIDGDFIIVDFEGEPSNTVAQRYTKHSPLRDVAGMIRSFHYASVVNKSSWFGRVRDTYLHSFLKHSAALWTDTSEVEDLLVFHLLERTVHEVLYEMKYRPEWVDIPFFGLVEIIGEIKKRKERQDSSQML